MSALVFDMYPRPQKEGDWNTKSHTMQRSIVRAARAHIKRVSGLVPQKTKTLETGSFDPGGMYCTYWPKIWVHTGTITVELAAIHMPEFIVALTRAEEEVPGAMYVHSGSFHVLVVTPAQRARLRKAAEALEAEAERLMGEFNAKASPTVRAITEKKIAGEAVIVGPNGLVKFPQGTN